MMSDDMGETVWRKPDDFDPLYDAAQQAVAVVAEGMPPWLITVAVNAALAVLDGQVAGVPSPTACPSVGYIRSDLAPEQISTLRGEVYALVSVLAQWNRQFEKAGIAQKTIGDSECDVLHNYRTLVFGENR